MLMVFEQETAGPAEAQPATLGNVLVFADGTEVDQHELTHLPFRCWCHDCVRSKGKESPHNESSPGGRVEGSPQITCSWAKMERQPLS